MGWMNKIINELMNKELPSLKDYSCHFSTCFAWRKTVGCEPWRLLPKSQIFSQSCVLFTPDENKTSWGTICYLWHSKHSLYTQWAVCTLTRVIHWVIERYHLRETDAPVYDGSREAEGCRCGLGWRELCGGSLRAFLEMWVYSVFNQPQAEEMASFQLDESQITKGR